MCCCEKCYCYNKGYENGVESNSSIISYLDKDIYFLNNKIKQLNEEIKLLKEVVLDSKKLLDKEL